MTQPDGLFPAGAANFGSFAEFASRSASEWEALVRGNELARWGEQLLDQLWAGLIQTGSFVMSLLSTILKRLFADAQLATVNTVEDVLDQLEAWSLALSQAANGAAGDLAALIDGVLGTGHQVQDLVNHLQDIGEKAANAIAYWLTVFNDTGQSTAALLASFITDGYDNAADAIANFGILLSNSGAAGMAALGTLIANLNTMLTQISDIFHGASVTPVNTVVQQIQDWWNSNAAYLSNIPNTAVQGLTGFGANIGASVQALSDAAWQGLRAFLGIPSGVGPPQVASAGQQVRVDLNNASDIATAAALYQANQAITKQSFLSIDPSADPVFPLSNITGASPSTVSVTQAKSVMGIIGLPDSGTKKSVVWLGGALTNITAVYVNLYKVNTTTGEFTRTHKSANIIGSLANPVSGVAWNFYNLPISDNFPTVQGDWYVAEIAITGTGTYSVVGVSNSWMPNHPTVYPKGLGASRTPSLATVTFDAVGAGANKRGQATTTTNITWNHTAAAGAYVVVGLVVGGSGSSGSQTPSATYGGAAMTLLGTQQMYTTSGYGTIALFGIRDTTGGTKTIVAQATSSTAVFSLTGNSVSYLNVVAVGTVTGNGNNTNSLSVSATGVTSGRTVGVFGENANSPATLGSYNQTQRYLSSPGANPDTMLQIGDSATTGAFSFSASQVNSSLNTWGAMAVVLLPDLATPPSSISSPTYDPATPWIALAGAAGRSQHLPETVEFETAGAHTYNVPSWVEDGDYIDIVPLGGGAGGSYSGNDGTTFDPSYQAGGAGQWNPIRLQYGDGYDIPTGTTTFTVNIGAPGTGGAATHPAHTPAHGTDGGDTTVVISGYPTITATGGAHDGSTITSGAYLGSNRVGDTPGNVVHQGITYFGGATADSGFPGNSPGGGGGAGISVHGVISTDFSGGPGAPGAVYITAVQN